MTLEPAAQLIDVAVGYGAQPVLEDIHLSLAPGRWTALVGPNASGKTTLLKSLAGLMPPLRGTLLIEGQPLYPARTWRGALPAFVVPPEELPPFLTVSQCLDIHAMAHGLASVPAATEELAGHVDLDIHAHTLIRNASLGTRQKLAILLALMLQPRLLLLDEVFNGLDFTSASRLRAYLRKRVDEGILTILLATHALDVVLACCDELILVDSGKLSRTREVARSSGIDPLRALLEPLYEYTVRG